MMRALQALLPADGQTPWGNILKKLHLTQHVTSQVLGEFQNLVSAHCHHLPSEISAMVSRCLEVVHDASCESDLRKLAPLVGRGLVYVGLLLAHFLSPRGPIDPMEKARIKLAHIEKEVSLGVTHYAFIKCLHNHNHQSLIPCLVTAFFFPS